MRARQLAEHTRRRHLAMYAAITPVWQDHNAIIRKIADAVGADERKFQRAIGAEWTDAYRADWATTDETCALLTEPERPHLLTRMRMIGSAR